jgi:hypothetical protein
VEFEFWPAVVAGLAGGAVMSAMIAMMRKAGKTEMDMALIEGSMFSGNRSTAKAIGMFMHLVVFSALIIGSIYAWLFDAFGVDAGDAWWVGALFGIVHGVIGGLVMGMIPAMHPRMRGGAQSDAVRGPGGRADGGVLLKEPGVFAKNYGKATPPGVLTVHVVYGLVVGLVYAWLAG